jgi:hypothetical protein
MSTMGGRFWRPAAAAVIGMVLAATSPAHPQTYGAETASFAHITTALKVNGYTVIVEAGDGRRAHVRDTSPPSVFLPNADPAAGHVCVAAIRQISKTRRRSVVMDSACPGPTTAYRFNQATMQASLVGEIATVRWTRIWRVRGNRWTLTTNKRRSSKAVANIMWQGSTPVTDFLFCGFGPGVQRTASASVAGSIAFPNLRITATLGSAHGRIGWSSCARAEPF